MAGAKKASKRTKAPKPKTYVVTPAEIQKYILRGKKEAIDECVVSLFGLTYLCLRDEFHFGKVRMLRAMRHLQGLVGDLSKQEFSIQDIQHELQREIGVDITDRTIFVPNEPPKKAN